MAFTIVVDETSTRIAAIVSSLARQHDVTHAFGPTDPLVDGGLTSGAMVELMLSIEREFDLTIPDEELNARNFFSIAALKALLVRLRSSQEASQMHVKSR